MTRQAFVVLAVVGAVGCDLALDIGSLDSVRPAEVVATGQCYPGAITVADGFVYWTTIRDPGDPTCGAGSANAIHRLGTGDGGTPTDVVTTDLDGIGTDYRPWSIAVSGSQIYWLGACGTMCTAPVDQVDGGCTLLPDQPSRCKGSQAMTGTGPELYFAGGCGDTCTATTMDAGGLTGLIEAYDTTTDASTPLSTLTLGKPARTLMSIAVGGGTLPSTPWVAWMEDSPTACKAGTLNHLSVGASGTPAWDSCQNSPSTPGSNPMDVVTDGTRVYWLAQAPDTTYELWELDLPPGGVGNLLVTGLLGAKALAVDANNVYFTTTNSAGSVFSVFFVPKGQLGVTSVDTLVPLATSVTPGIAYGITADDPTWVYWFVVAAAGSVERTLKP